MGLNQPELQSAIIANPLTVSPQMTVMEAITQMSGTCSQCNTEPSQKHPHRHQLHQQAKASCVIIVHEGQVLGIFTERDVVRLSAQQRPLEHLTIEQVMIRPVITLRQSAFTDLFLAVNLLKQYQIRHLPIVDEQNQLMGLVTHETLREISQPIDLLRMRIVAEVMTTDVICAEPQASLLEIAQSMARHQISCVVIVEPHSNSGLQPIPIGIFTERDLVQFRALGLNLEQYSVGNLMSTPIFTVSPQVTLGTVHQMMQQHFIHRVVVIGEQGELLGIITQSNLLQAINPLELYKLAEVLEAKVAKLESEKLKLLENRTHELEIQITERTTALQKKTQQEKLVAEIALQIRSSLHLQTILETTVEQVRLLLNCERVTIWRWDADGTQTVVAECTTSPFSMLGEQFEKIDLPENLDSPGDEPMIIVSDLYNAQISEDHRQLLQRFQIRAKILVPIVNYNHGIWGFLNACEGQAPRNWQPEEVELLKSLSVQLGIAIQSALSHEKLVKAQQISHLGTWELDIQNNLLSWSEETFRIFEIEPSAGIDSYYSFLSLIHPDDRDKVNAAYTRHLRDRTPYKITHRLLMPDGRVKYVEEQCETIYGKNNTPMLSQGTVQDVTHLKQTELALETLNTELEERVQQRTAQLLEHEARLQQVIEELSQFKLALDQAAIVAITDAQGVITYANDRFCQISGYSREELIGQTHRIINSGYHDPSFFRNLWQTISRGEIWRGEICNRAKNHQIYWISSTIIPFLNAQGKPWQYLAIRFDITDRKRLEFEHEELISALQKSNNLLFAISEAQSEFITAGDRLLIFENLLSRLLELTESEYGFIGEVLFQEDGSVRIEESFLKIRGVPYLKTHSISNVAWNEATQKLYEENYINGMEFHNLNTLFGAVITTGKPVIANHPSTDPRRGGTPDGHPPLNAFLGLPFFKGTTLVGMVGIANKPGGYDQSMINYLQPFLVTCTNLIEGYRWQRERKEAEMARLLAEQEITKQLASIEAAVDGIAILQDNCYQYLNPSHIKMFGYEQSQELLGKSWKQFYSPQEIERFEQEVFPVLAADHYWKGEAIAIRKDGTTFIEELSLTLTEDQLLICVCRDITDRKQAEIALQASENRFRKVFDSNVVGMMFTDFSGNVIDANDRFLEMIGYTRSDLINDRINWLEMTPPEHLANDQKAIEYLQKYHCIDPWEKEYYHKNGSRVPVLLGVALFTENDSSCVCVVVDIKDRKEAENLIQQQAEREKLLREITQRIRQSLDLETIFNTACHEVRQVLQADRVGVFQFYPDSGFDDGEFVAESVAEGLPSVLEIRVHDHCFGEKYAPLYAQGRYYAMDDIYHNGLDVCHVDVLAQFQVRANLVMSLLCGEQLWGLLCIHQCTTTRQWDQLEIDFTQQIANQLAIGIYQTNLFEQLRQELSQRQETQQQLTERNQQLAVSNEELLRATRLKDEFLANMSHELRTPLNAILGMTEGLEEEVFGGINQQQKKALQTIERSGSHLLSLINDILDVAKIESGQMELDLTAISVRYLCQSSVTFVKQQALKKQIQLEMIVSENLPELWADERRIRQVLINLLNNAVKFTPEGGKITIEATFKVEKERPYLQMSVTDTGIGIAPENISKLFQPFIQVDSALNRQYAGTGLGLSLVKRIVELHGGEVGVSSEVGAGSCFTVQLPCTGTPEWVLSTAEISNSEQLSPPPGPGSVVGPESFPLILLAEDNEANISTISSYLRAKGYRLIFAENGEQAIAMAESENPDLILMDIQMPGMDGLEAIGQIRQNPKLVNIPIIAITALAMSGDEERCLTAGANAYLPKPLKLKQLVTMIQNLLVTS